MPHPFDPSASLGVFDRYSAFVDIAALKAATEKPLRKCVRVNTLKCTVAEFQEWAREKNWQLTKVPWCSEGFFVERENRETALGRDLRHLLGHFYMQEAASMLPASLLDAQPGEAILDLCAAPGSKTTQIAAALALQQFALIPGPSPSHPACPCGEGGRPTYCVGTRGAKLPLSPQESGAGRERGSGGEANISSRGVIVANDVQEKRLWTLKNALYRSGVTNAIVMKKVGQWYGKNMTERFDRVLCDAPCTAQGTARKGSDALAYSSEKSIQACARLQAELLEAAIHAAKVGGRIVYSTCTLTPEENEAVVLALLAKFDGCLEVMDPRNHQHSGLFDSAIEDSLLVQKWLITHSPKLTAQSFAFLRLWPQTYDTEGFFCAILRKTAPTRDRIKMQSVPLQESLLRKSDRERLSSTLEKNYGTDFLRSGEALLLRSDIVLLSTEEALHFPLPEKDYAIGLPFAKDLKDGRFRPVQESVTLRGHEAQKNVWDVPEEKLHDLLSGKDSDCPASLAGDIILRYRGFALGSGLAREGRLMNRIGREVVRLFA
ncbi:MAG: hypothetical protein V1926_04105 [Candidatus Peregrinibacteria bacterium]